MSRLTDKEFATLDRLIAKLGDDRHIMISKDGERCTLFAYVTGNRGDYATGTEADLAASYDKAMVHLAGKEADALKLQTAKEMREAIIDTLDGIPALDRKAVLEAINAIPIKE